MASPIPPVAPVTKAVLPVRSNMQLFLSLARSAGSSFEGGDIIRRADGNATRILGYTPQQAGQDLAGADLVKRAHALLRHEGDRLAPTHRPRHLLDQCLHDVGRLTDRGGADIGHHRNDRPADRHLGQGLAGILADQATQVLASFAPWCTLRAAARSEDWVLLTGKREPTGA